MTKLTKNKRLKKFPNIEIFRKDGCYTYAKTISQKYSNTQQVNDYFHLVKKY